MRINKPIINKVKRIGKKVVVGGLIVGASYGIAKEVSKKPIFENRTKKLKDRTTQTLNIGSDSLNNRLDSLNSNSSLNKIYYLDKENIKKYNLPPIPTNNLIKFISPEDRKKITIMIDSAARRMDIQMLGDRKLLNNIIEHRRKLENLGERNAEYIATYTYLLSLEPRKFEKYFTKEHISRISKIVKKLDPKVIKEIKKISNEIGIGSSVLTLLLIIFRERVAQLYKRARFRAIISNVRKGFLKPKRKISP